MLKKNSLPTQLEMRISLGDELANVVFKLSHKEISRILGISLAGPEKGLYMSSSDQLMGKNYLKSPIHTDYIKACSHNAILQIGEQVLEKYRQKTEERIKMKFLQDLDREKNLSKAETRRVVKDVFEKTQEQYENRILELKSHFTKELEYQLENTMNDCKLKMQEAILEERENISREMLEKIKDEIEFVTNSLNNNFELKLIAEKEKMMTEFNETTRSHLYFMFRKNALLY
ncbi:uncharacterized protein LOC127283503 isoform X2 [Leptopilina boulardi]|uniref:uncharacterized protein LOC127283503 isoform X2 n=1 Tax=Leptopilina boulardi TaxID=63433 RepID=UPI0021F526DF|nr:uncharacterized protein LOC127283503 isoform X2 [Leptopilina boulardi]